MNASEEDMDDSEEMDGGESDDSSGEESEPAPATLTFTGSVKPEDAQAERGEEVNFVVITSNDGDETWSGEFELLVDGEVVATEQHELQGRALDKYGVTWQIPSDFETGEYTTALRADDQEASGSLTVVAAEDEEETGVEPAESIEDVNGTPEDVVAEFFELVDNGDFDEAYSLFHSEGQANEFGSDEGLLEASTLELQGTSRDYESNDPVRVVVFAEQYLDGFGEDTVPYDMRPEDREWRIWGYGETTGDY